MKLVIDANILFSALLRQGITRTMLLLGSHELYVPFYFFEELNGNIDELKHKLLVSKEEILSVVDEFIRYGSITVVAIEDYISFLGEGRLISPDLDDAPYLALALHLSCALWSNDRKLKEQKRVAVYSTTELLAMV
ncbi:MAG TPA: PIN domain-containing protein [Candidatus Nanoarchaeia archaeon]|nr:PIN domain-containing protein [Candidatus Nanoarchaeia archaeon]